MTDDEIVALGQFCETVRSPFSWRVLVETFEKQVFDHMMGTEPHEQKKREGIWAQYQGAKDFLAHMDAG